jgi:flagellar biosynthesis/type III secretory pathway protein FliH
VNWDEKMIRNLSPQKRKELYEDCSVETLAILEKILEEEKKVQAYLAALEAVGKEHGFSLGHEDGHGAFLVFRGGGGDWFTGARLQVDA